VTSIDFASALARFLARRGIAIDRPEVAIACFLHQDTRPSLRVSVEQGTWFCDPCGQGGGALDLVEGLEGCDRKTALRILGDDALAASSPPRVPRRKPERSRTLDPGLLVAARRKLVSPAATPALEWLATAWKVPPRVVLAYGAGLGPEARIQTSDGSAVATFSLAVPSFREGTLSGVKLYRPRARELGGDHAPKCIAEKGSRPALVGGHLLGDAEGRVVVLVGGEKDALVAAAALPDLVLVAHAGGEGAWRPERAVALAGEIVQARPARIVVALDANEIERGTPDAVAALYRAGAGEVRVLDWPPDFVAAYPKGGAAQFLLDPRCGPEAFRSLVAAARTVARGELHPEINMIQKRITTEAETETLERPRIEVGPEILSMVEAAEEALLAAKVEIFVFGNELARVVRDNGQARVLPLVFPYLKALLARHVEWVGFKDGEARPALPPRDVVETLLAKGEWPFPVLDAIVTTPSLRPDGTVLDTPGYDPASRLLFAPDREYPKVPEHPTLDDARRALEELRAPLVDFCFLGPADRAAAIAVVATVVGRPAIDGPTPLTPIRGNVPGCGKGLLADVIACAAIGRLLERFVQPKNVEEEEKRFLSLAGERLVLLDNLEGVLASPVLAAVLTSVRFSGRKLGRNEKIQVPVPVLVATANNLSLGGDIARRSVPCDLEFLGENPEQRSGFRYELPSWAIKEHARLVVAALTILRAYVVAGRPPQTLSAFGSYEAWSALVRSALVWAGEEDPCRTRERLGESDMARAELRTALFLWRASYGEEPRTAAQALADAPQALRDALLALAPKADPAKFNAQRLGYVLRAKQRRVVEGLRFDRAGETRDSVALWRVVATTPHDPHSPPILGTVARASNHENGNGLDESAGDAGSISESLRTHARAHTRESGAPAETIPRIASIPRTRGKGDEAVPPLSPGWTEEPDESDHLDH
jgi:hypothetical protein